MGAQIPTVPSVDGVPRRERIEGHVITKGRDLPTDPRERRELAPLGVDGRPSPPQRKPSSPYNRPIEARVGRIEMRPPPYRRTPMPMANRGLGPLGEE